MVRARRLLNFWLTLLIANPPPEEYWRQCRHGGPTGPIQLFRFFCITTTSSQTHPPSGSLMGAHIQSPIRTGFSLRHCPQPPGSYGGALPLDAPSYRASMMGGVSQPVWGLGPSPKTPPR